MLTYADQGEETEILGKLPVTPQIKLSFVRNGPGKTTLLDAIFPTHASQFDIDLQPISESHNPL